MPRQICASGVETLAQIDVPGRTVPNDPQRQPLLPLQRIEEQAPGACVSLREARSASDLRRLHALMQKRR